MVQQITSNAAVVVPEEQQHVTLCPQSTTTATLESSNNVDGHCSEHLMPPDLISVSTASRDDDSVSSLSTSDEVCCRRRTLFPEHWQKASTKAGGANKFLGSSIATCFHNSHAHCDDDSCSANTYERVLKKQEGVHGRTTGKNQRRKLFGNLPAVPSLRRGNSFDLQLPSYYARNPSIWPQSYSDSALVVEKTSSSCLRPCKYSSCNGSRPSQQHGSHDCCRHVSFDKTITVTKYSIPQEQWASSGWSSYFY